MRWDEIISTIVAYDVAPRPGIAILYDTNDTKRRRVIAASVVAGALSSSDNRYALTISFESEIFEQTRVLPDLLAIEFDPLTLQEIGVWRFSTVADFSGVGDEVRIDFYLPGDIPPWIQRAYDLYTELKASQEIKAPPRQG